MLSFDEAFYLAQNPDVAAAIEAGLIASAEAHFNLIGFQEGRDPNPLFDVSFYLQQYPDVAQAGTNPFDHFNSMGGGENRNPNALFDAAYYLEQNPDVAAAGISPFEHFLNNGAQEGRDPSPNFDISYYLEQYPDVAEAGINPLLHYLKYGIFEGRSPLAPSGDPPPPENLPNPGDGGDGGGDGGAGGAGGGGGGGPDNTAPVVTASQSFDLAENGADGAVVGTVAATDAVGVTGFAITGGDDAGYFAIDANGQITLTAAGAAAAPGDFESGPNSFALTVTASDAAGNTSAGETVTVNITDVDENTVPEATAQTLGTAEDVAVAGTVTGTDAENDPLTYAIVVNSAVGGTVTSFDGQTGDFTFTPGIDFSGEASFQFTANDGAETSTPAEITVDVSGQPDVPSVGIQVPNTVEEGQAFTVQLTAEVSDTDNPGDTEQITLVTLAGLPAGFQVTDDEANTATSDGDPINVTNWDLSGNLTVTPTGDFNGDLTLTIEVDVNENGITIAGIQASDDISIEPPADNTAPVVAEEQSFELAENSVANTVVGSVQATDNVGVNGYEITDGDDNDYFSIDANGQITLTADGVNAAINDFAALPNSVDLTITASDAAGNTSAEETVTVNTTPLVAAVSAVFRANFGGAGFELGITDGTPEGTRLEADTIPGFESGNVNDITRFGDDGLLFTVTQEAGAPVRELPYHYDLQTQTLTQLSTDIYSFGSYADLGNGRALFYGSNGNSGTELHVTDGTPDGTELVLTIRGGAGSGVGSSPIATGIGNGRAVFMADDGGLVGHALWVSDGTAANTTRLTDTLYSTREFVSTRDGKVFFPGDTTSNGRELWVTDGTIPGTGMVVELWNADNIQRSSSPESLVPFGNDRIVFAAQNQDGHHIWISDGTEAGTQRLSDNETSPENQTIHGVMALSDGVVLYFTSPNRSTSYQMWRTEGTPETTQRVGTFEFTDAPIMSKFAQLRDGLAVFSAGDAEHGEELWITDGTAEGTALVADIALGPGSSIPTDFTSLGNGQVSFTAFSGEWNDGENNRSAGENGLELWVTDGTAQGTLRLDDFDTSGSSRPASFLAGENDGTFFRANDGLHGKELWRFDEATNTATLLADVVPGVENSHATPEAVLGDLLLFTATTPEDGDELWVSDGTEAGTQLLRDTYPGERDGFPDYFVTLDTDGDGSDDLAIYRANDGTGQGLWATDGTVAGTAKITGTGQDDLTDIRDMHAIDDQRVLISAGTAATGRELWIYDVPQNSISLLRDIVAGTGDGFVSHFAQASEDLVYFAAETPDGERSQLWQTDGTSQNTELLFDFDSDPQSNDNSYQQIQAIVPTSDGNVFISVYTPTPGPSTQSFFYYNSTTGETTALAELSAGPVSNLPEIAALNNGSVLFGVKELDGSRSIWITDGTAANTGHLVPEAQTDFDFVGEMAMLGDGRVVFAADDGEGAGRELWITDGTADNTQMLVDIYDGENSSFPTGFAPTSDGRVVFSANAEGEGYEFFVTDGTVDGTTLIGINQTSEGSEPSDVTPLL
ncbi:Ig-like domain-containing protein [Roseibium sp.]|uniref:Ig-like domain-containing protein n=1 Tax=Roseibium sp. TaxID=1936156 RepID=UPI003B518A69